MTSELLILTSNDRKTPFDELKRPLIMSKLQTLRTQLKLSDLATVSDHLNRVPLARLSERHFRADLHLDRRTSTGLQIQTGKTRKRMSISEKIRFQNILSIMFHIIDLLSVLACTLSFTIPLLQDYYKPSQKVLV